MNKIQNRNPKNFFGIFDSPEYKTQTFSTTKNLNVENYWLQNLPIFNTGNFIKPLRQDFQSKDIVQFPYISTVNLNKLIGTSNMVLPLPILQSNVATLTSTNIHNNKQKHKKYYEC